MPDPTTPPLPPGFTLDTAGPVYGAPPRPAGTPSGYAPVDAPVTPLKPVPGGPSDPMRISPDPGYHLMPDNSEVPNKGGPHDPSNPESSLTPEALDDTTSKLILTGQMDPMGMGGGPVRLQILNNRPVMLHKYGLTDQQLPSIRTQFQADSTAYSQRIQQLSFIKQASDATNQHIQQIAGYLNTLPAQTDAKAINAVSNYAQRQMSGDTITQLDATIPLLKSEIAKIMTASPTGSGQLSDDARHEFDTLEGNGSPHSKLLALAALQQMADGKINGLKTETEGLRSRLTGGLQAYAQLAHGGLIGGGSPPPGGPGSPPPPMPNDPVAPASGGTKDVVDPNMTPVRREYMARLNAGQSAGDLVSFLRQSGVSDPATLRSAAQQAQFRRQHPDIPIGQYDTAAIDHHQEQMGVANKAMNAVGQTGLGAGALAAGNAVAGGYLPEVAGALGGNTEQARLAAKYSGQDHPGAALAGSVVGGTTAALAGEGALGAAGMEAGVGRTLLADTGYGTFAGSGSNPDNRLGGAGMGLVAGAVGSLGGQALAKGGSALIRGVTSKSVNALADAGVPLTVGQAVGQSGRVGAVVKGAEDRLAGFSGVGDMIKARQGEGYRAFNSKAFDKALEPIGATVNGATGEEAVQKASQAVSGAFSSALKGKVAVPDPEFVQAARGPMERLAAIKRDGLGSEIVGQIEESTKDLFDPKTGSLSGENMQTFLDSLRQIRQSYKGDPLYARVIGPSIKGLESATEGMFTRQAPEVMPAFNAAKAAYRRMSILSDAVNRAKNDNQSVFTPGQLGLADRTNAKKYDGAISAASGNSPFHDFHKDAVTVLPSKVPDSGTAGRLALAAGATSLPAIGAGAGYLGGDTKDGALGGIGLTGILALAYTKAGQKRIAQMLLSRSPAARALAEKITARIPIAGAAGTALTQTNGGQ